MIQQSHSWGYTQKNATQVTPEAPAHHVYSSAIHSSQIMETAKMPHLMNELGKCGTYTQWSFTQP
jgi:hypothetical protein